MTGQLTRRKFLTLVARLASIGALALFLKPGKVKSKTRIKVPFPQRNGISLFEGCVVVKKGREYSVFSRECTHLGCDLTLDSDGQLACPCHGSRFSDDGNPLYGPARNPLVKLNVKLSADSKYLLVELED